MRAMILKNGSWESRIIPIGSNIKGLRIFKESVSLHPDELTKFAREQGKDKLNEWFETLQTCYKKN